MSENVPTHYPFLCFTPRTFMRRQGSMWCCTCGQVYVLVWSYMPPYADKWKRWAPVEQLKGQE